MKTKVQSRSDWVSHLSAMEIQYGLGIGSFSGHRGGEPPSFPAYVVSFKDVADNMDYHIRHTFVSCDDFFPRPVWRLPFLTFVILAFLLVVSLQGLKTYLVYNPPPPPPVHVQVEVCEAEGEKALNGCQELRAAEAKGYASWEREALRAATQKLEKSHAMGKSKLKTKLRKCNQDYKALANSCDDDCVDLIERRRVELTRRFGDLSRETLTFEDPVKR